MWKERLVKLSSIKTNKTTFQLEWFKDQFRKIRMVIPQSVMSNEELKKYLLDKYSKRRLSYGYLYNNVTKKTTRMSQEDFINLLLQHDYIVSGYGTIFRNQIGTMNIGAEALNFLLKTRAEYKKKMFEAKEEGNKDDEIYYNLIQLTYKVLANSYYGITSMPTSHFYNSYIQNSITKTGQIIIQTSVMAFEAFLENNIKFKNTNDILTFINNIKTDPKKFDIFEYLPERTVEETYKKLINTLYEPKDDEIVRKAVESLDPDTRSRVFYKSNIYAVLDAPYFTDLLEKIINSDFDIIEEEKVEKIQPSEEMQKLVDHMNELLLEFVHYDHLYEDRAKRANMDKKRAVLIVDTDSNFVHLNNLYQYVAKKYNLNTEDRVQKNVILNIFIKMLEKVVEKTYWTLTTNMGLHEDYRKIIRMKSEFLMGRMLITNNKKNYAALIIMQEGNIFKSPEVLIKGLPIKKSVVPKDLRPLYMNILEEKILKAERISIREILNEYDKLANIIRNSLLSGSLEYAIPKAVKLIEEYEAPHTQQAIRGVLAWNYFFPEQEIQLPEKVNLLKLDCTKPDDPRLEQLKKTHPREYKIIMEKIFEIDKEEKSPYAKYGFTAISIPQDVEKIPDFLIPFIAIDDIIDTNLAAGLSMLQALGIVTYKSTAGPNKRTNIIEI